MSSQSNGTSRANGKTGPKVLAWRNNTRGRTNTNWSDVDADLIRRAIYRVTSNGGSIMFGVTSDGGAFSILVLHGDQKMRDYPHGIGECKESLEALDNAFDDFLST
jgi:hypothetical protein